MITRKPQRSCICHGEITQHLPHYHGVTAMLHSHQDSHSTHTEALPSVVACSMSADTFFFLLHFKLKNRLTKKTTTGFYGYEYFDPIVYCAYYGKYLKKLLLRNWTVFGSTLFSLKDSFGCLKKCVSRCSKKSRIESPDHKVLFPC